MTTPSLYANPYDTSKSGFYFDSFAQYVKKAKKSRAEEFEIEFIDGDEVDQELFEAMHVNQSNIEEYFDMVDELDDEDVIKLAILTKDLGHDFSDAMDKKDDLIVYGEFKDDEEFAMEYVDGIGSIGDALGEKAEIYFDYDSFGRDLRLSGDLDRLSGDLDDDEDEDGEGRYDGMSDQEVGEEVVEQMGGVGELDKKTQELYFDWTSFARDLMFDMSKYDDTYYDPNSI